MKAMWKLPHTKLTQSLLDACNDWKKRATFNSPIGDGGGGRQRAA